MALNPLWSLRRLNIAHSLTKNVAQRLLGFFDLAEKAFHAYNISLKDRRSHTGPPSRDIALEIKDRRRVERVFSDTRLHGIAYGLDRQKVSDVS